MPLAYIAQPSIVNNMMKHLILEGLFDDFDSDKNSVHQAIDIETLLDNINNAPLLPDESTNKACRIGGRISTIEIKNNTLYIIASDQAAKCTFASSELAMILDFANNHNLKKIFIKTPGVRGVSIVNIPIYINPKYSKSTNIIDISIETNSSLVINRPPTDHPLIHSFKNVQLIAPYVGIASGITDIPDLKNIDIKTDTLHIDAYEIHKLAELKTSNIKIQKAIRKCDINQLVLKFNYDYIHTREVYPILKKICQENNIQGINDLSDELFNLLGLKIPAGVDEFRLNASGSTGKGKFFALLRAYKDHIEFLQH